MAGTVLAEIPAGNLVDALDRCHARMEAATAEMLDLVAAYDERQAWRADGATCMTGWLAARFRRAWSTTGVWVEVARGLRRLPAIRVAYRRGRLSWDQLRPLVRFAEPQTEAVWVERASRMRPRALWMEARRHERVRREQAAAEHRMRYLRLAWNEPKTQLYLEGQLAAEQGAAVEAALQQRAERLDPKGEPPLDPLGARMADALVAAVTATGTGAPQTTLAVHTEAAVLARARAGAKPGLAETDSGVRLSEEAVRRLACEANVEWVLESDGHPIGVGRSSRKPPASLIAQVRRRDHGCCVFPGCEQTWWVMAHHIRHWADGGPTDLDNLALLCFGHHRLVHEGGWSMRGTPGQDLRFHRPDGRPLTAPDGRWRSRHPARAP